MAQIRFDGPPIIKMTCGFRALSILPLTLCVAKELFRFDGLRPKVDSGDEDDGGGRFRRLVCCGTKMAILSFFNRSCWAPSWHMNLLMPHFEGKFEPDSSQRHVDDSEVVPESPHELRTAISSSLQTSTSRCSGSLSVVAWLDHRKSVALLKSGSPVSLQAPRHVLLSSAMRSRMLSGISACSATVTSLQQSTARPF